MPPDSLHKNDPCHCGSGRKYKHCCRAKDRQGADLRSGRVKALLQWAGIAVVLFAVGYGLSRTGSSETVQYRTGASGVRERIPYYTVSDITEVDFSGMTEGQTKEVMDEANRLRCSCGCQMTLAQCIAIDRTCPIRSSNIVRLKGMIEKKSG